jgi:hypothetical protein
LFSSSGFWLGLTDAASEGTWLWLDGTPLSWVLWSPKEGYDGPLENVAHTNTYLHTYEDYWADWDNTFLDLTYAVCEYLHGKYICR